MIFDTCPVNDEIEMAVCRAYELQDVPNLVHIWVEADVDHQGHGKPYWFSEQSEVFDEWAGRIIIVRATGLPTVEEDAWSWARERAQREFCAQGLVEGGCESEDVVLHGDLDEIVYPLVARNLRPRGYLALAQHPFFWSCRWAYPQMWQGTVAALAKNVRSFNLMRDSRNQSPVLPDAGAHLSWMPKNGLSPDESAWAKLGSFCHPEAEAQIAYGLADGRNRFLEMGIHVDGVKMTRCEVDGRHPRWVREGKCPESWLL